MRERKNSITQKKITHDDQLYIRRRRIVSLVSLAAMIGVFAVVAIAFKPILAAVAEPEQLREWLAGHGALGYLALIGIMCVQVVVAIIPGEVVEIAAGYAYGAIPGMICCLIGTAIGSAIIFGFTKVFGIKMVEAFISREKINSLKFINTAKKLDMLTFIIFFIPGTPKDVITYFIGLTPMKLHTFLLISTIARIPSVISSTLGGDALGMQSYLLAVIVFAVTGVVSLIGVLIYRRISGQDKPNS